VFGFLGRVFGAPGAAKKLVDTVASGLDAIHYSAEEKAADARKLQQMDANDRARAREWFIKWMEASSGQALARRLIAVSFTSVAVVLLLMSVVCAAAGWHEASAAALEGLDRIDTVMLFVVTFYFGPHVLQRFLDKGGRFMGVRERKD